MFEGWVAEVLATYLGKFIDVQRDRLRISLWGGETWHQRMAVPSHLPMTSDYDERGGARNVAVAGQCVLENVQLRPEAFDYLKLPVAIGAGSVGRLCLKVLLPSRQNNPLHDASCACLWLLVGLLLGMLVGVLLLGGSLHISASSQSCIHGFLTHVPYVLPARFSSASGAAALTPVLPDSTAR